MPREIILVRYAARPFKDHWAIFVPSVPKKDFGTLIQVEGNVRQGFELSIIRNYDLQGTRRRVELTLIGKVDDKYVHTTPSQGDQINKVSDTKDEIERVARSVVAPGPSMRETTTNLPPGGRVQFSDCQLWVRKVTEELVAKGILESGAIRVLDDTPRN